MPDLLIVAKESKALRELCAGLEKADCACSIVHSEGEASAALAADSADLVLVEAAARFNSGVWDFIRGVKRERALPVIALLADGLPDNSTNLLDTDDFLTAPYDVKELTVRIRRLLRGGAPEEGALIKCNDLVINLTNCDVTVGGKVVELTFKEYELLKLLAGNRGRVYTREDLLNKIWGYDYFGGDRTVDVHVRRLRSKIEGPETFIETVRNIGYRFKKG